MAGLAESLIAGNLLVAEAKLMKALAENLGPIFRKQLRFVKICSR